MPLPLAGFFVSGIFAKFVSVTIIAIIVKVVVAIGITFVIFTGFDTAITAIQTTVINQLGALPVATLAIFEKTGAVDFINIQFSAMLSVIAIKTSTAGLKRLVFKQ